jgi:hypothetical protein
LLYFREEAGGFHLYVTTLEVATELPGEPQGDDAVLTTTEQQASDASGTNVVIPENVTVQFPAGEPHEIQITTPIDPAVEEQLPEDVDAVPVIREFGPAGTTFTEPITITISYTDAEVAGYIEAELRVFRYNPGSGKFDDEITTITAQDTDHNTISFTVMHFSVFGLGASPPPQVPLHIASAMVMALLAFGMARLRSVPSPSIPSLQDDKS